MLIGILESYIEAINNNDPLNISYAWNYICKNECSKAMSEGLSIY